MWVKSYNELSGNDREGENVPRNRVPIKAVFTALDAAHTPIVGAAEGRPLFFRTPDARRETVASNSDETAGNFAYAALYEGVLRAERVTVAGK